MRREQTAALRVQTALRGRRAKQELAHRVRDKAQSRRVVSGSRFYSAFCILDLLVISFSNHVALTLSACLHRAGIHILEANALPSQPITSSASRPAHTHAHAGWGHFCAASGQLRCIAGSRLAPSPSSLQASACHRLRALPHP